MKAVMQVKLGPGDYERGVTRHYSDGRLLPAPHSLRIVEDTHNHQYYLLYLDAEGNEQTDTWHETVRSAMDQAEFEVGIEPSEWEQVNN